MKQDSKVGCQWPALEVGSARPLAIPTQTRLAAASPFHGCLVSPGSKRGFTYCLPNHVDNWSVSYVAGRVRDGCHTGSGYFSTDSILDVLRSFQGVIAH